MTALDAWIEDEARFAAREMVRAISATDIVKNRPGFGQRVVPAPGSVLASPVPAAYDPDPDYFFHWHRDAAIVIDALRVAFAEGWLGAEAVERFREFVRFNQSLKNVDGREFLARSNFRDRVQPSFLQYLRPDAEIAAVKGDALLADVRVNADGTLDFTRWARPQNDGPPLLALALMRWQRRPELDGDLRDSLNALISVDLEFTLARANAPSFDIWEEENGFHYFTQLAQAEALARGVAWLTRLGDGSSSRACAVAAREIASRLDELWDATAGHYRSRTGVEDGDPLKKRDIAVVLATLYAGREAGPHSVLDPRAQATLAALEDFFGAEYLINRGRDGPAMGRYPGDIYYSGGAWYVSTLAAAEFYYRLAAALASRAELSAAPENLGFRQLLGGTSAGAAFARGDAFMRTCALSRRRPANSPSSSTGPPARSPPPSIWPGAMPPSSPPRRAGTGLRGHASRTPLCDRQRRLDDPLAEIAAHPEQ